MASRYLCEHVDMAYGQCGRVTVHFDYGEWRCDEHRMPLPEGMAGAVEALKRALAICRALPHLHPVLRDSKTLTELDSLLALALYQQPRPEADAGPAGGNVDVPEDEIPF